MTPDELSASGLRYVVDGVVATITLGLVPDLTGTKPLVESVEYVRALEIRATASLKAGQ